MTTPDEEEHQKTRAHKLARDARSAQLSAHDLEAKIVDVANAVARTEDHVAATMDRMAEQRPGNRDRYKNLSEAARNQAARCRRWAHDHSPAGEEETPTRGAA